MATSATVALPPEKEASRPNGKSGRLTSNLIINGEENYTAMQLQAQRLRSHHIPECRLSLLASLIWEVRHG